MRTRRVVALVVLCAALLLLLRTTIATGPTPVAPGHGTATSGTATSMEADPNAVRREHAKRARVQGARRAGEGGGLLAEADAPEPDADPKPGGERSAADIVDLPYVEAVEITVMDAEGHPAAGAEVVLYENHPRSNYDYWRRGATATTDGGGHARLEVEGGVGLQVRATRGETVSVGSPPTRGEDRVGRVRMRLGAGTRLVGRVIDADTLAPVIDAHVYLTTAPWDLEAHADANGRFSLGPLSASAQLGALLDNALLRVFAPGYSDDESALELRNRIAEIRLKRTTRVVFRLVDPDGRPLAARAGHVKTRRGHSGTAFETGSDGNAAVDVVLDPGADLAIRPKRGATFHAPPTDTRLAERMLGDVVVHPVGTVSGVVVDTAGSPVHLAFVRIAQASGGFSLDVDTTNPQGEFELEGIGPGDHVIRVERRNRPERSFTLSGVRSADQGVRIVVPALAD